MRKKKIQIKGHCGVCGQPIAGDSTRRLYCSEDCAEKKMREQLKELAERRKVKAAAEKVAEKPCDICSVPFKPFRSTNKYCSSVCAERGQERAVERQRERREATKKEKVKV